MKRAGYATTVIVSLAVGAGLVIRFLGGGGSAADAAAQTDAQPVTVAVEWAALTSQVRLGGQLTYGEPQPLPPAAGTITGLPAVGDVFAAGDMAYEVDGEPVVVFPGERPFWRELSVHSDPGVDVRQLESHLSDLGFLTGDIDNRFDWRTRQAVREWQTSNGLKSTGEFSPATVVVTSSAGLRIAHISARLGDQNVSPATFTHTDLWATVRLTRAQAAALAVGTLVRVTLPDGTDIETEVAAVDLGGEPLDNGEGTTSPYASIQFADQTQVAQAGAVAVTVVLLDQAAHDPTLVVPATALLATADGGYAVEVYQEDGVVRTPVTIGRVVDARVEVLSSGTETDTGIGPVLGDGDLVVLSP